MTQNSQTCSRRFERVREGSRGFERVRDSQTCSRGFERVRDSQTCSRRFERVPEGSRGFERVRETHLKPVREGSRGFERVREGSRRAIAAQNWFEMGEREDNCQSQQPEADGQDLGCSNIALMWHPGFVASPSICQQIVSKSCFCASSAWATLFLKEARSAYGAYEKMSKIWRIVLAFVIFKILFNI